MLGKRNRLFLLFLLVAGLVMVACGGPADELTATLDTAKPSETAVAAVATATTEPTPTAAATATTAATATAEPSATATTAPIVTAAPIITQPARPQSLVQRIQFAPGATSAAVTGQVGAGQRDVWLFYALAGQPATISLSSPGNAANFTLSGLDDGQFYKWASDPALQWSGTLPLNQDYIVVVTAPAATSYNLTVAIAPLASTASIRGLVWHDLDRDNVMDSNEAVGGVPVRLASPNCAVLVAETYSTEVGGAYAFYNVAPGTYCVMAIVPGVSVSTLVELSAGEQAVDVNLTWPGPVALGSIRGLVWRDLNLDDQMGENELVGGATVELWGGPECGLLVNQTTSTQAGGAYAFYNLEAGTYCLEATSPEATVSVLYVLAAGEDAVDINLMLPGPPATGSIRGLVWDDANLNGQVDAGETFDGVIVSLLSGPNCSAQVAQTTTAIGGAYAFYNLAAGTYCVEVTVDQGSASALVELAAGEQAVDVNLMGPG